LLRLPAASWSASCDLAVASERQASRPGVDIGLFCSTPMVALSRNVPRKQAMENAADRRADHAATAKDIGLINRVVRPAPSATPRCAGAQVALKSA